MYILMCCKMNTNEENGGNKWVKHTRKEIIKQGKTDGNQTFHYIIFE